MEPNLLTVKKAKELLDKFPDDMLLAWLDDETGTFLIPHELVEVDISLDYIGDRKEFKNYAHLNSWKDVNNYPTIKCITFDVP